MSAIKWLLHNYGRKSNCQRFGQNPTTVRDSNHYNDEYIDGLVERWDLLIDWIARAKNESRFIIGELRKRGSEKVLDVATGTGFDSIRLKKKGFSVTSMDGNYNMLIKAKKMLSTSGFKIIDIFSDFSRTYCTQRCESYLYVAEKMV